MCITLKDKYDLKFNYIIHKNGKIINNDNNREIKPYIDERRKGQPPIIYLKKNDGKRLCIYHDVLMCETFDDMYTNNMPIIHIDGDPLNCNFDNLYAVNDGLSTLINFYKEVKEWKSVKLNDINLYYKYFICEDGRLYNATTDSFIKPFKDEREDKSHNGYLRYNLYIGKNITDVIHISAARLVALHFIPKQNKRYDIVIYKDNDYTNIDKSNLYWGDRYDSLLKSKENVSRTLEYLEDEIYGIEEWTKMKYFKIRFEDYYLISSFGRIYNKSKEFYVTQIDGCSNKFNQSYKICNINIKNIGFKNIPVHRLVAYNFCYNVDYSIYRCVNHINGNPSFNYAKNLEWCTPYENLHHALNINLIKNKEFKSNYKSKEMRFIILLAWLYGTNENLDDQLAYEFYKKYSIAYNDKFIDGIVNLDEFISVVNEYSNSEDYQKLYHFYKNYN